MTNQSGRPPSHWLRRLILTLFQAALFVLVWVACDAGSHKFGVRIPAGVLGLGLVLVLLFSGVVKPRHLQFGADFLLAEMLLFFTPAFVAAMTYFGLFAAEGLRLVAAVALGTIIVMAGTVWVVDKVFHWESKRSAALDE